MMLFETQSESFHDLRQLPERELMLLVVQI